MILGLRTAIYPVGNLAEGRRWYASVLGLEPFQNPNFDSGSVR